MSFDMIPRSAIFPEEAKARQKKREEQKALAEAERQAGEEQIKQEAIRSALQDEMNGLEKQKQYYMDLANKWGKLRPGSQEQKDALDQASNLDAEIAKRRAAVSNPRPATAAPAPEPMAKQMPAPIKQGQYPPDVTAQMRPTTKPAPAPAPKAQDFGPSLSGVPKNTAMMPAYKAPLKWKFGGAEGNWNEFNPDTGQSESMSGGPVERPSTPDYINPGIGGGAPSPAQLSPVMADVSRGGGGFYMPSENDVAYLPDSVLEEAQKRNELAALRSQQEALGSIPPTIELPKELAPAGTRISSQDYVNKVLPALIQLQLLGQRYQSPQEKVQTLSQVQDEFNARIDALTKQAAKEASSIPDKAERDRISEKYRAAIENLKNQRDQASGLLGVPKDLLGGI
jgi:hypothetical protein